MEDVTAAAEAWIEADPDPETRAELRALLESEDIAAIAERMDGTLEFGTAGLRGKVEAGSNRMNRAVIIRTSRGLADYLLATTSDRRGPVVVGRDARPSSSQFLADTVGVLTAAGLDVVYLDEPMPTPAVAFLAKQLEACAGVVITASHNPPADNGYKVYAANAVQIVPPTDRAIAEAIDRVGPARHVPIVTDPLDVGMTTRFRDSVRSDYFAAVAESMPGVTADRNIRIVYSAMHGVGGRFVEMVLSRFGFRSFHPVAEQFEPDGRFPTVAFPNPEEEGAMDMSVALAAAIDADLVLANDPDADRLAVSLPLPGGGWRQLTGNQVGVLLADFLLEHATTADPLVVQSIVSSPMLEVVARAHQARYDRSLTGFKWIWNAALDLEAAGKGTFVFGYEEALGYSVGRTVRDKDGISAALAFALLAGNAAATRQTVWDRLEHLYRTHGLWVSGQRSIVRAGPDGAAEIAAAMAVLETSLPEELGGLAVTGVVDYRSGEEARPRWLPNTDLVELSLDGGRVLIRPSGTEPKLKIYADLHRALAAEEDWMAAEEELAGVADGVAVDLARFVGVAD